MNEKLIILDGNSLLNRAFYALPPLTNAEGLHTNAIYGFANMLFKMRDEIKPDYIVCTFDRKAPTFRHQEYKDYKAGRKKMPPELAEQFPVVKDFLKLLAIDSFEIDGFEADDLIGTLSVYAEKKGIEVYIVTGDRDALQLATDNVKVIITKKGITEKEIYDRKRMIEDFGVTPTQFIDVKGLMGDSSDNIPGVPGIGEKTAFKLISKYGSIENVLSDVENISGKKIKESLMENCEQAIFSKKLATIMTDVPIEIDMDSIKSKTDYDAEGLRQLFFRLQFKSLLDKIEVTEKASITQEESRLEYKNITNIDELTKFASLVSNGKSRTLYMFFSLPDEIYASCEEQNYMIDFKSIYDENAEKASMLLNSIFDIEDLEVVSHDIKTSITMLSKMNIFINCKIFDTCIAAYLLNSSKSEYTLITLINEYLRKEIREEGKEALMRKTILLRELANILKAEIEKAGMNSLLYDVELPLVETLAFMEREGFKVEPHKLDELGVKFKSEMGKAENEIYDLAGESFNINSPKQLGKILFEKLDLPVIKRTKTGYSTNAEVLEELSDKHPIIDKITYFRQLTKLYSTYIEGLKAVIDKDGKIHSSFNQTVTTTGRLSSTEPNLQNIPVKYEMGKEIRKVFIPEDENSVILSADYSQIELRVLAHIADDKNLISAFKEHSDIHTKTASEVFKVPIDQVTHAMRSNAKAVNFGIVYGISDFSLAKDLKIPRKEAKSYIDTYFERYPNVKKYMEDIVKKAEEDGYVTTIMNRRRFIPEIKGPNKIMKALGERLAMNAPIQGSAADIIKLAMVNVYKDLKNKNLKSKLILQVHDELILNVYKDELDEVKALVKEDMEKVLDLSVPLEVDINVGDTWYDAK